MNISPLELIRIFFAALIALVLGFEVFVRYDPEESPGEDSARRLQPVVAPGLLPLSFGSLFAVALLVPDWLGPAEVLRFLPNVFLIIAVYYTVLLALLPLLRRWISAAAVAVLWTLPNYLYILAWRWTSYPSPKFVWRVDGTALRVALAVWAAGFAGVMLWKIVSHLVFRRRVLKNARPVEDQALLERWMEAQTAAGVKKAVYRLMISPAVASPLSVGLWPRTTRVLLPERDYTPEELDLIFRHELVHIRREDSDAKFFLAFCSAMCWFNPLMWMASRRCAEDLELSCDELALRGAADADRRRYAELLLSSAGESRGFTTCLSSSAESLRYRLKNVVHPKKKLTGGVAVGLAMFALILINGVAAFAYDGVSGADLLFGGDPARVTLGPGSVTVVRDGGYESMRCTDPAALADYLAGLEIWSITTDYAEPDDNIPRIVVQYDSADGKHYGVFLQGRALRLTRFGGKSLDQESRWLAEPVDWEYLSALLVPEQG